MKKFLTAILLVLAVLASAGTATAATWTNLNGVTSTGAGSTLAFTTTPGLQAHIYSTAGSSATAPTYGLLKWSWTNSTITAGAGGTTLDATVGTLPAKSQPLSAYVIVDGQATFAAGTLKAGLGVAGTTYVDWIVSSDIKAAAGTVYGDAAAERGTDMAIKFYATAQTVKTQFIAGAGDLANVTGSSGTVYVTYMVFP